MAIRCDHKVIQKKTLLESSHWLVKSMLRPLAVYIYIFVTQVDVIHLTSLPSSDCCSETQMQAMSFNLLNLHVPCDDIDGIDEIFREENYPEHPEGNEQGTSSQVIP